MSLLLNGDLNIPLVGDTNDNNNNNNNNNYMHTDNDSTTTHRTTAEHMIELHNNRTNRRVGNSIGVSINNQGNDSSGGSDAISLSNRSVETDNAIVDVINISNEVNIEKDCDITKEMVKQCIRTQIWVNNKFLTDQSMKNMTITDRNNPNTIINLLLARTRKLNYSDAHRFRFWKKYGSLVQKELNTIKTVCTRSIKNYLMRGKINMNIYLYYKI